MNSGVPEKKKTVKLKVDGQSNFKLIGISSHENDYRLVWAINEHMKLQFTRIENLIIHQVKLQSDLEFGRYLFHDEDRYFKLYLISNRCPDGFLFPEVKNIDFLLQVIGDVSEQELKSLVKGLKAVPVVSAAFELPTNKLKGAANILVE